MNTIKQSLSLLAVQWLKNEQGRLDLWKKYHQKISKAVSPALTGGAAK